MRVMVINNFGRDELRFGESDMRRIQGDYVKIKFEDWDKPELCHAGFTFPATDENIALYEEYKKYRTETEDEISRKMFLTLNRMKRKV